MMPEIKFKKNFAKLHNQEYCFILDVIAIKGWELSDKFLKYDTENDFKIEKNKKYLLIFCMGDEFIPFTTIRTYNDENIVKYRSPDEENSYFKIVIENNGEKQ